MFNTMCRRFAQGLLVATVSLAGVAHAQTCGDTDCNGQATVRDALLVLQRAVGVIDEATCVDACGQTSPTTSVTSTTLEDCAADEVTIDAEGTIDALVPGVRTTIPVTATGTGTFDLLLDDNVGGDLECEYDDCLLAVFLEAGVPETFEFFYTPPAGASGEVTISLELSPHSEGYNCDFGSTSGYANKTFPLANP
jgi:hypothetical protein